LVISIARKVIRVKIHDTLMLTVPNDLICSIWIVYTKNKCHYTTRVSFTPLPESCPPLEISGTCSHFFFKG